MGVTVRDGIATFTFEEKEISVRVIRKNDGDVFFFTLPRGTVTAYEFAEFKKAVNEAGITPALIWGDLSDLAVVSKEELFELRDTLNEVLGEE